jgi:hypothetical protein
VGKNYAILFMGKRFRLNEGDVFTIPLNENEVGFGQVISPYNKMSGGFLAVLFDCKSDKLANVPLASICETDIIFLGFTFDAKIYHNDWCVIGNYIANLSNIIYPYHRVISNGKMVLEDYKSNVISEINEKTFSQLSNKTEIAPIRYENALKAHFGLQEWKAEDYDKLLYENSIKSNKIFQRI